MYDRRAAELPLNHEREGSGSLEGCLGAQLPHGTLGNNRGDRVSRTPTRLHVAEGCGPVERAAEGHWLVLLNLGVGLIHKGQGEPFVNPFG